MLACGDADRARGLVPKLAERGELDFDLVEPRTHRPEQAFARLGWRYAARAARQEPKTEPLLESTDGVTQRRWRHTELGRGAGKAPLARDGEKGKQVVEVLAWHCELNSQTHAHSAS